MATEYYLMSLSVLFTSPQVFGEAKGRTNYFLHKIILLFPSLADTDILSLFSLEIEATEWSNRDKELLIINKRMSFEGHLFSILFLSELCPARSYLHHMILMMQSGMRGGSHFREILFVLIGQLSSKQKYHWLVYRP